MQEINQNFPSVVSSLSRMKVNCFSVRMYSVLVVNFFITNCNIYLDLIVWYAFKFFAAQWIYQRGNCYKSANDSTWKVINGPEWCLSQFWRYWPLSVMPSLASRPSSSLPPPSIYFHVQFISYRICYCIILFALRRSKTEMCSKFWSVWT